MIGKPLNEFGVSIYGTRGIGEGIARAKMNDLSIPNGPNMRLRVKNIKSTFQDNIQHFLDEELKVCDKAYNGPSMKAYGGPSSQVKGLEHLVNVSWACEP